MDELGLVSDGIDYPGVPATSAASAGLVAMELSRGDGSLATFAGVEAGLTMRSIDHFGSEEQKRRWLAALARCEALGAFALTEPDHGSDSLLLETSAVQDGDAYVLNGAKRWIGTAASPASAPSPDCEHGRAGLVLMGWRPAAAGVTLRLTGFVPSSGFVRLLLPAPARPETLA